MLTKARTRAAWPCRGVDVKNGGSSRFCARGLVDAELFLRLGFTGRRVVALWSRIGGEGSVEFTDGGEMRWRTELT